MDWAPSSIMSSATIQLSQPLLLTKINSSGMSQIVICMYIYWKSMLMLFHTLLSTHFTPYSIPIVYFIKKFKLGNHFYFKKEIQYVQKYIIVYNISNCKKVHFQDNKENNPHNELFESGCVESNCLHWYWNNTLFYWQYLLDLKDVFHSTILEKQFHSSHDPLELLRVLFQQAGLFCTNHILSNQDSHIVPFQLKIYSH